ncbi:MAG: UDP-N-acetylmuramate:L-alanyl-gamma-D-glutamyl-meso-diaminopimelate ligase, partial [Pyrinomonadaceae bacterium]
NRYANRRLIAVFEPRSWSSRLAVFQEEYANAFAAADYVVISSVFDGKKVVEKGEALNTSKLIEDISRHDKPAFVFPTATEIIDHLLPQMRHGDVVAIMSNGGFDGIHDRLLEKLKAKSRRQ